MADFSNDFYSTWLGIKDYSPLNKSGKISANNLQVIIMPNQWRQAKIIHFKNVPFVNDNFETLSVSII